jgi:hypothetical protein
VSSAEVTVGGESGGGDPTACALTAQWRSAADTTALAPKERWQRFSWHARGIEGV